MNYSKPEILQLSVTGTCNYKCIMCNIWQNGRTDDLSVQDFKSILGTSLFSQIKCVGIHGGEPTMRKDLIEICQVITDTLPSLEGACILTNGYKGKSYADTFEHINTLFQSKGIAFSVLVSIDGLNEIHDINRGVRNSFSKASSLLFELLKRNIKAFPACTVTQANIHQVREIHSWFKEKKLEYYTFRLASPIARLNNNDCDHNWTFTNNQKFDLSTFFEDLANMGVGGEFRQNIYNNLSDHLSMNTGRQTQCLYQSKGICLHYNGELSYCSVSGPSLGNALTADPEVLYSQKLEERERMVSSDCINCLHDCCSINPSQDLRSRALPKARPTPDKYTQAVPYVNKTAEWKNVLITGWYGTETAGDKAILGALISQIRVKYPNVHIFISSINDRALYQTMRELEVENFSIIGLDEIPSPSLIKQVQAVIMGGGPLEEINQTDFILRAFQLAAEYQVERIIFGCGYGPFHTQKIQSMVEEICTLATSGFFRDEESLVRAHNAGIQTNLKVAYDSAFSFIHSKFQKKQRHNEIIVLARAGTPQYWNKSSEELHEMDINFLDKIIPALARFANENQVTVKFLPMHQLNIGGNDRDFNNFIENKIQQSNEHFDYKVEKGYLPINKLVSYINRAEMTIPVRYHGHIFSAALNTPFISIDYTGSKNKVSELLRKLNWENETMKWQSPDTKQFYNLLKSTWEKRLELAQKLKNANNKISEELANIYNELF
ncbi:MAG: polysaccharide pyruvyl transferase family protein [Lentisphaerales bacterium]|nr:polysaccharide pyruvyl transferase family protein [Lentisphaerales bacterium]